jgi:hypothetical protein
MNDDFYTIISEIIARLSILERYAGGGGGSPNLDGGLPDSNYNAIENIDAGGI